VKIDPGAVEPPSTPEAPHGGTEEPREGGRCGRARAPSGPRRRPPPGAPHAPCAPARSPIASSATASEAPVTVGVADRDPGLLPPGAERIFGEFDGAPRRVPLDDE